MTDISDATELAREAAHSLFAYCRCQNWAGYDPYDALNSKLVAAMPFFRFRTLQLALTQMLKRLPVNLRGLLAVSKTQNPKALALFLTSFVKLLTIETTERDALPELIARMTERLGALRSPNDRYWCWGYSFPWQSRTAYIPKGTPNLVCTTFVANALLDTFERCGNEQCLTMGISAAEYILNELYWSKGNAAAFSYPQPSVRTPVHNANFLGAALLARVYSYTGQERLLAAALRTARYSASKQGSDGAWQYGEAASQQWVDNFHTGYNLCALRALTGYAHTHEFDSILKRGFDFYCRHFIGQDGVVRYFHDRRYPIDTHAVAQSIITLLTFKGSDPYNMQLACSVLTWTLRHMRDEKGFFYYQVHRTYTNRIPYMRWSQAWMLLAIVEFLEVSAQAMIVNTSPLPGREFVGRA